MPSGGDMMQISSEPTTNHISVSKGCQSNKTASLYVAGAKTKGSFYLVGSSQVEEPKVI